MVVRHKWERDRSKSSRTKTTPIVDFEAFRRWAADQQRTAATVRTEAESHAAATFKQVRDEISSRWREHDRRHLRAIRTGTLPARYNKAVYSVPHQVLGEMVGLLNLIEDAVNHNQTRLAVLRALAVGELHAKLCFAEKAARGGRAKAAKQSSALEFLVIAVKAALEAGADSMRQACTSVISNGPGEPGIKFDTLYRRCLYLRRRKLGAFSAHHKE